MMKKEKNEMREVIYIEQGESAAKKPVKFTHRFAETGILADVTEPDYYDKVVYLGKCSIDGDMFAAYKGTTIEIVKGVLNSGKY